MSTTTIYGIWQNRRLGSLFTTRDLAERWIDEDRQKWPGPRNADSYPEVIELQLHGQTSDGKLRIDGLEVSVYRSELDHDTGKPVVQIDGGGPVRVNINDAPIWDANPDEHEHQFCPCSNERLEHHGPQLYEYIGHVVRWVDGDTVDMELRKETDFGFGFSATHRYKVRCRLLGVDTPERGDEPGFSDAKNYCKLHAPEGTDVSVRTDWDPSKYGQPLVDITGPNGWSLSHALIEVGLGKPYFGGTKS